MVNTAEEKPLTSERFIKPVNVGTSERAVSEGFLSNPLFVTLLVWSLAVVSWFGSQTYQLGSERRQLANIKANQQVQVDAATKIRANIDGLAASTQRLANSGNANAQLIVDELKKRGVTINPDATTKKP